MSDANEVPGWRECADPDELAAAVAAGVEVLRMRGGGWVPSALTHRDDFAWVVAFGTRYQLPASWTWRPEPTPEPDDLRERIARAMFDRDGFAVRWDEASVNTTARYSRLADAVLAVLPTPLPVPPWPGAVLSGLTDEDGVPTWLAQAGNVQGESVRTCADFPWFVCGSDNASDRTWVEVRAPRAVPEPETERVDALKVLRDRSYRVVWMKDHAAPACSIGPWNDDVAVWSAAECRGYVQPIAPDGTVEVLKDGGQ